MITITKEVFTETAHRLFDYEGDCSNIHGHSYRWQVTIGGEIDEKTGMLIDFKQLKLIIEIAIVELFDHCLVLNQKDPLYRSLKKAKHYGKNKKIYGMSGNPTVENFVDLIADDLIDEIDRNPLVSQSRLKLISVKCWETEKSFAEWRSE